MPPTPACADDAPPGNIILAIEDDPMLDGGEFRARDTASRYKRAVFGASMTATSLACGDEDFAVVLPGEVEEARSKTQIQPLELSV